MKFSLITVKLSFRNVQVNMCVSTPDVEICSMYMNLIFDVLFIEISILLKSWKRWCYSLCTVTIEYSIILLLIKLSI